MKTADLIDDFDAELDFCHLPFLKVGQRRSFYGPIQTVKCFEDNVLFKAELQKPGKGRVLVVDGGGSTRIAILGDMNGALAIKNNWAGIIINGAIRDIAELSQMDIGLHCLGTTPKKSVKRGEGSVGIPIQFGGVHFTPGDYVYADEDGVLVAKRNVMEKA